MLTTSPISAFSPTTPPPAYSPGGFRWPPVPGSFRRLRGAFGDASVSTPSPFHPDLQRNGVPQLANPQRRRRQQLQLHHPAEGRTSTDEAPKDDEAAEGQETYGIVVRAAVSPRTPAAAIELAAPAGPGPSSARPRSALTPGARTPGGRILPPQLPPPNSPLPAPPTTPRLSRNTARPRSEREVQRGRSERRQREREAECERKVEHEREAELDREAEAQLHEHEQEREMEHEVERERGRQHERERAERRRERRRQGRERVEAWGHAGRSSLGTYSHSLASGSNSAIVSGPVSASAYAPSTSSVSGSQPLSRQTSYASLRSHGSIATVEADRRQRPTNVVRTDSYTSLASFPSAPPLSRSISFASDLPHSHSHSHGFVTPGPGRSESNGSSGGWSSGSSHASRPDRSGPRSALVGTPSIFTSLAPLSARMRTISCKNTTASGASGRISPLDTIASIAGLGRSASSRVNKPLPVIPATPPADEAATPTGTHSRTPILSTPTAAAPQTRPKLGTVVPFPPAPVSAIERIESTTPTDDSERNARKRDARWHSWHTRSDSNGSAISGSTSATSTSISTVSGDDEEMDAMIAASMASHQRRFALPLHVRTDSIAEAAATASAPPPDSDTDFEFDLKVLQSRGVTLETRALPTWRKCLNVIDDTFKGVPMR